MIYYRRIIKTYVFYIFSGTMTTCFLEMGTFKSFGIYINAYLDEFNVSVTVASMISGIFSITFCFAGKERSPLFHVIKNACIAQCSSHLYTKVTLPPFLCCVTLLYKKLRNSSKVLRNARKLFE